MRGSRLKVGNSDHFVNTVLQPLIVLVIFAVCVVLASSHWRLETNGGGNADPEKMSVLQSFDYVQSVGVLNYAVDESFDTQLFNYVYV